MANLKGLSTKQAAQNLKQYGYNEIPSKTDYKVFKIIIGQFSSFLVLLLIAAGGVSIFIGEYVDGIAIITIIIINSIIGFTQEYKAENAVSKLKDLVIPTTIVIRNGENQSIPIRDLVPEDLIILNEGDKVPADVQLIESFSIKCDESMLTGESVPVDKNPSGKGKEQLLFKGTIISTGHGMAKVIHTGPRTEFGKIIKLLENHSESKSPLSLQLDELGRKIGIVTIAIMALLFIIGYFRNVPPFEMLMTSVALGVSAIPEGLPIIVTLTLAMGVEILARKKAIVRKMNSIETLGATTIICSDKTGTLTMNEMTVSVINTNFQEVEIPGQGYKIEKYISLQSPEQKILLEICENCNSAYYGKQLLGDPTEIALKVLARKARHAKAYKKIDELVFTSERKMMSTYHKRGKIGFSFTKGAYEEVLKRCTHIMKNGRKCKLSASDKHKIEKLATGYSEQALRVLAFAYCEGTFSEENLTFVGLVGIIDPPRKSVKESIRIALNAGIKVKIITGDNAITARAVSEKIGLHVENIVTGEQLDQMTDSQLLKIIEKTQIFARTKPEHKYRIVDLLQKNHEVVAVTGDGVNDAPALKHADVGVAMGIKGTEASKEVADIVLKDDNFSTIVKTIEEGRRIYHNILAFIKYMLSANFITLVLVGIITISGYPLPILAIQVLWLNVATDALPALALGRSPASPGIMNESPHQKKENIFYKFLSFIISAMVIQVIANLIIYRYGLQIDAQSGIDSFDLHSASHARTLVFCQTVIFELLFAFVCKEERNVTIKSLKSNPSLILAGLLSLIAQIAVVYVPFLQEAFRTTALEPKEWLLVFALASTAFIIPSFNNLFKRA